MFIRKYIEFFSGFFILRAWDGSGNFTRSNGTQSGATTWADADAAGNDITTSQHDTHDEDLADGIAACLTKNNESKPTATFKPNADASYDLGSTLLRWKDLFLSGDLAVGGGDITSAATTFNLLATPTTVNAFAGASVALTIGHASAAAAFPGGIAPAKLVDISGAAAGQIKFPATQNASADANTLDDYEEGTWTPNQGTGLTLVGGFSSNGQYTKIGRMVRAQGQVVGATSVAVSTTGQISSNLPFTSNAGPNGGFGSATNNSANVSVGTFINPSATDLYATTAIAASASIFFDITYFV